ncbi:HpcH/HpaI aldolase/citrate lyase family protein [Marivita sp. S2033]|uniref:HpcH/HpaI aldolase/citrate lyase family protein n=1 Tax=Marivita sp. S2033 TaxID=3373187 RepID=UPI003982A37A
MVIQYRSLLFVPATRPDRFAKAAASGADAVILDLEDAVADAEKDQARTALRWSEAGVPCFVRVNALGTPWHDADLAAVRDLPIAGIMLPKSEEPDEVARIASGLGGRNLIALIETAKGLANARAIAALEGVDRLAFGSVDFCSDMGCAHERDILLPARFELVLASRLAGIGAPIDGVTVRLDDEAEIASDARHARDLGFGGKLCIHPKQIACVKEAFAPSDAEIDWANRVLASGDGAVSVDGAMVDAPVRARARSILAARQI